VTTSFDALILAGGGAERLGGIDKATITIGGATLLERAVGAVEAARAVVCVGPQRDVGCPVVWTREHPVGGGPVAGLSAGLDLVEASIVVVLAVDHPFVTTELVARLVETCALDGVDAALAGDDAGIAQPLLAAYRVAWLSACLRAIGSPAGASMTRLIEGLRFVTVPAPVAARDLDTPEDLERARREGGQAAV
jgi:molybdopterin-guanine dinucleotide biosynthesis protein A